MNTIALDKKQRIHSIDILRGMIMIIMVLDHVRDYFTNITFDPLDLNQTTPALFLTRWITHYCAPTFVFLAGVSAFLSTSARKSKKEASLFLLSRGLWLILLEITVITFGFFFDTGFHTIMMQVIWVIGWGMMLLAIFVHLKPVYAAIFGLILIFGHNAFDHIRAENVGEYGVLWTMMHQPGVAPLGGTRIALFLYPLIPWIGVISCGYAFGTIFKLPQTQRVKWLKRTGVLCIGLFIAVRLVNLYGDPSPWQDHNEWWKTLLDFVKCNKYPPSLQYLLMTLGVSILSLAAIEKLWSPAGKILLAYGRVPFFFYLLHIYLIHILQLVTGFIIGFDITTLLKNSANTPRGGWGFDLEWVYLIWILVVVILYFPCRWFMKVKQKRKDWWLSYI